jgi:uncharacterized YigZ family protein
MYTLPAPATATLVIKQSKFIAHLVPFRMFEDTVSALRSEHPKARHLVTAYRSLNAFDQVVEGSSDDGEPKGTSGRPTLAVLQGHDLIEVAIITVRYFGGTKLGTGGLVRAYSDVANLAIDASELQRYTKRISSTFFCSYGDVGKVEYLLGTSGVEIIEKRFDPLAVYMMVQATQEALEVFYTAAGRMVDDQTSCS